MTEEERITQLEQRANKFERNDKGFAEAIKALMESSVHHSGMMDDFFRGMNELRAAQANTDVKLAALVDAQIRAEVELKEMREGMNELRGIVKQMTQAIIQTNKRVDELERTSS